MNDDSTVIATGIAGLDQILRGGLPAGHVHLVDGPPGSGKTTLALQFLLEGARRGEAGVYVTLSETEAELHKIARSHGWTLNGKLTICDLNRAEDNLKAESQYTLFHPSEVELSETTETVLRTVSSHRPARVVFDSLSEMRLLARDSLRYRRQVLALKSYFAEQGCTVLLLDTGGTSDYQIDSVAYGVIKLEQKEQIYGGARRRLRVQKMRGLQFAEGWHDFAIRRGGLEVFPRVVAAEHRREPDGETISSGLATLDSLFGGGLNRGTSAMFLGPSGAGKSTLAMQYVHAAIERGERAAVFLFDEGERVWRTRARGLGMSVGDAIDRGTLRLHPVSPAMLSPGEFADRIRRDVEDGTGLIVIDSLNGYEAAMPEERFLHLHLHELLSFLSHRSVVTLMTVVQHGLLGEAVRSPMELSYLADTIVLVRFFEAFGAVRQAMTVVKQRSGEHEHTVRELHISGTRGVMVGEELRDFSGVLSGSLTYHGERPKLLGRNGDH